MRSLWRKNRDGLHRTVTLILFLGVSAFLVAPASAQCYCEGLVEQTMGICEHCNVCDICTETGYDDCIWFSSCGPGGQCDNHYGSLPGCGIGWRPAIAASCGGADPCTFRASPSGLGLPRACRVPVPPAPAEASPDTHSPVGAESATAAVTG